MAESFPLIEAAIKLTCGEERIVVKVESQPTHGLDRLMGGPVQQGFVTSNSLTCPHTRPCLWIDIVYCFEGRYVVVQDKELPSLSLFALRQRLRGKELPK